MTPTKERPGIPGPAPDAIRNERIAVRVERAYRSLLDKREATARARRVYHASLKEAIDGGESAAAIARRLGLSRQAVNRDSRLPVD